MERSSFPQTETWFIGVPSADPLAAESRPADRPAHYRIEVKVGDAPWEARYLSNNRGQVEAIWKQFFFPGDALIRLLKDGVPIASKVVKI